MPRQQIVSPKIGKPSGHFSQANAIEFPTDLSLNTTYKLVVKYDLKTQNTTLWINPDSEASPSVTATDAAGNSASCMTCIDLVPIHVTVAGGANALPGVLGALAPADFTLAASGDLAQTGAVEYFVRGVSIGAGSGADFRLAWSKVQAGSYTLIGVAARKGSPDLRIESVPVYLLVTPPSSIPRTTATRGPIRVF